MLYICCQWNKIENKNVNILKKIYIITAIYIVYIIGSKNIILRNILILLKCKNK